ncbi:MAG: DUF2800 domain-containing protein, partial [Candidatus Peribacteraceae bacterium]|nr:DUF2800 domain-containing protein [Candidatus Peribacteraceae bacterium]
MGKHSILSPSGGDRWVPCPGSVAFIRSLITSGVLGEEEEDDDPMSPSNEGTRAHLLLSTSLDNGVCAEEARHIMPEEDLPYITEEMPDHVQGVINWIADYMEENPGTELWVERKVSAEPYTGTKETAGTLDVGLLNFPRKELIVLDFKYGMGVAVHPDDAIQLDIYGLGALAEFNENDFKITTRIIAQPRHPRVDTFQIQRDTTKKFVKRAGKISTAARIALSPGAHLNPLNFEPGEKQCRWCRGSPFCEY